MNGIRAIVTKEGLVVKNTESNPEKLSWDNLAKFASDIGLTPHSFAWVTGTNDGQDVIIQVPAQNTASYFFPKERVITISI